MEIQELFKDVIDELAIKKIHPLHKLIFDECCENAINTGETDKKTLLSVVQQSFILALNSLKSTLTVSLNQTSSDHVILNYRGETFSINKSSVFILK